MARPLRIESFDVRDGRIAAVDGAVPLAVEADLATGRVLGVWTWEPAAGRRGRPVATDVILTGTGVVVASPAAGGLVRIDRTTGVATVLTLDADVGHLVWNGDGDALWAVGASAEEADPTWPRRPVVWEGRPAGATGPDDLDDDDDDDPDPSMRIEPSTPVWRVEGDSVIAYDLGGRVENLAILSDEVVAVCTRPTDPLVKRWSGPGFISFERPATLLRGDPALGRAAVGAVSDGCGSLLVDREAAWLVGFDADEGPATVWRLGTEDEAPVLMRTVGWREPEPLLVAAGRVVGLEWRRGSRLAHIAAVDPAAGGGELTVDLPGVDDDARVDGGMVWFRRQDRPAVNGGWQDDEPWP
jgi:hypothetical protein